MSKIKDKIIQTQEEYYEKKLRELGIEIKDENLETIQIRITDERDFTFEKYEIYNVNEFGIQFKKVFTVYGEMSKKIYTFPYDKIIYIMCTYKMP